MTRTDRVSSNRRRPPPGGRRRGQRIVIGAIAFVLVVPLALEFLRIVLTGAGTGRIIGVAIGAGFVAAAVAVVVIIRARAER